MKQLADKINGYGVWFRFLTPAMIAVIGWLTIYLINDIKEDIGEIKSDAKIAATGMINHLEHHRILEIDLSKRYTSFDIRLEHIEQLLQGGRNAR